jgi:hypothetical protein
MIAQTELPDLASRGQREAGFFSDGPGAFFWRCAPGNELLTLIAPPSRPGGF